jgi:hypothetical protein
MEANFFVYVALNGLSSCAGMGQPADSGWALHMD